MVAQGRRAAAAAAAAALAVLGSAPAAAHDKDSGAGPDPGADLVITTTAGTGETGPAGDGGPAVQASLQGPAALADGPDGALYVVDGAQIRVIAADGTIDTVAGTGGTGFSGDGGPAARARFEPEGGGIAAASDGTVYVADTANHRVRAIDPDKGTVRTVAGSGPAEDPWLDGAFKGDGGPADKARLSRPSDVAVGDDGTVYIADAGNYRVRTVDPDNGRIETIAGVEHAGDGGAGFFPEPDTEEEGVPATEVFVEPKGIDVGADGTVFFTENDKDRVRTVDPDNGKIRTVAGSAGLKSAGAVAVGADGMVYVTDPESFRVVAMAADSEGAAAGAEAVAGSGRRDYSGDGGPPTDAGMTPGGIALADDGTLHVTDIGRIRTVGPEKKGTAAPDPTAARIATAVGGGTTRVEDAWFSFGSIGAHDLRITEPERLAVGPDGAITFADAGNDRVAAADPSAGTVRTVAGGGDVQHRDVPGDGIDPDDAMFLNPVAVAVGADGTRYLAGEDGGVFSLDADRGTLAPHIDGLGEPAYGVADIAVGPRGGVYFTDSRNSRIRVAGAGGKTATVVEDSGGTSPALSGLAAVQHIAVGDDGTVYFSDPAASRVRAVDPDDRSVRVVAGNGLPGFSGDGHSALSASLAAPKGLAVGKDGTLYIADSGNNRVRAVDPGSGTIRTVAGSGPDWSSDSMVASFTGDFGGDNGPATRAELNGPSDVAVGDDGIVYVADTGNDRIRAIGAPGALPSPRSPWTVPVAAGVLLAGAAGAAVYAVRLRRRRTAGAVVPATEHGAAAENPDPDPETPAPHGEGGGDPGGDGPRGGAE